MPSLVLCPAQQRSSAKCTLRVARSRLSHRNGKAAAPERRRGRNGNCFPSSHAEKPHLVSHRVPTSGAENGFRTSSGKAQAWLDVSCSARPPDRCRNPGLEHCIPTKVSLRVQPQCNFVYSLISDDLRPELNLAYEQPHMVTPNLDRLASKGVAFLAYAAVAVCCPSR
jgi:hypothetical protein